MAGLLGRSWLAVLVVLGLVVGLLGAGVDRAQGQNDPMASNTTIYSACVGAAAESAGFEDTAGLGSESAIDCIGYYGITQGRTETIYAPTQAVSRWQMALFLARAAGPAGVVLADPAPDQGFTDIGGLSEEAANAVNALAQADIMEGRRGTTLFAPDDSVTRQEMAVLLDAFLGSAVLSDGSLGDEGGDSEYPDDVRELDNPFTDISNVSRGTFSAIGRIYEIGVTLGRTATTFVPNGLVTRGEMAQFITRMLAHTIARPAGISIQTEMSSILGNPEGDAPATVVIAVRDSDFQPAVDALVDVIVVADSDIEMAFSDAGTCDLVAGVVSSPVDSETACEISEGDLLLDETGEETVVIDVPGENVTVWAWTGDNGDTFDRDTTTAAQANIGFSNEATKVLITDNLAANQTHLEHGDTWRVTLQLADGDNNPVAEAGREIQIRTTEDTDRRASSTAETVRTTTEVTDANGRIELPFNHRDPDPGSNPADADEDTFVEVAVVDPSDLTVEAMSGGGITCERVDVNGTNDAIGCTAEWSDDAPVATTLRLDSPRDYTDRSVRNAEIRVTATLTDQYGEGIRRTVYFSADSVIDTDGNMVTTERRTNSRGQAHYTVSAPTMDRAVDVIRVEIREDDMMTAVTGDDLGEQTENHYWVIELPTDETVTNLTILAVDKDRNQIVFDSGTNQFRIVLYDDNDQFDIGDATALMADFEEQLDVDDMITVSNYETGDNGVSSFNLTNAS